MTTLEIILAIAFALCAVGWYGANRIIDRQRNIIDGLERRITRISDAYTRAVRQRDASYRAAALAPPSTHVVHYPNWEN